MDKKLKENRLRNSIKNFINYILITSVLILAIFSFKHIFIKKQITFKSKFTNNEDSFLINNYFTDNKQKDINKITLEELENIPGISKNNAKAIINFREHNGEFMYIEDLIYVKGIGEKTFQKIKDYFYVSNNN